MEIWILEKVYFQVPDTIMQVLDNTKTFLQSGIISFWITLALLKKCKYHISGDTGTPEMFQYSLILGRSSILNLKCTFSDFCITQKYIS